MKENDDSGFSIRDYVAENSPGAQVLEPAVWDSALIGVVERINMEPVACYDFEKLVAAALDQGMADRQEAVEYLDFNVLGSYVGEFTPMLLFRPG